LGVGAGAAEFAVEAEANFWMRFTRAAPSRKTFRSVCVPVSSMDISYSAIFISFFIMIGFTSFTIRSTFFRTTRL